MKDQILDLARRQTCYWDSDCTETTCCIDTMCAHLSECSSLRNFPLPIYSACVIENDCNSSCCVNNFCQDPGHCLKRSIPIITIILIISLFAILGFLAYVLVKQCKQPRRRPSRLKAKTPSSDNKQEIFAFTDLPQKEESFEKSFNLKTKKVKMPNFSND